MTAETRQAQFIRLGCQIGAPRFLARCGDPTAVRQCARAVGDHGRYKAEEAARVLGRLFADIRCMEIGREPYPVVYVSLAFTRRQRDPASSDVPLEPFEVLHQRKLTAEAARELHADQARELKDGSGRVIRVRLHWE